MQSIRRAADRGRTSGNGIISRHSFSYGDYLSRDHMGFGPLVALNEDHVAPGAAYPAQTNANMEVLSFVVSGSFTYADSLGNTALVGPGGLVGLGAGTGVRHQGRNAAAGASLSLLRLWIVPERDALEPRLTVARAPAEARSGRLRPLATREGAEGTVPLHRDVTVACASLAAGQGVTHRVAEGRGAWLQVIRGRVSAADTGLEPGDGLAVSGAPNLRIDALSAAEILLVDVVL
ncbi:MAG: pirin family protein [Pseudomonadota bacterium]